MNLVERLCEWIARKLPARVIRGSDGSPYLSRYTLLRFGDRRVYLHHIHRGDEDTALHDHPWRRSYALILVGGYFEERRVSLSEQLHWTTPAAMLNMVVGYGALFQPSHVVRRELKPGMVNRINADTFHRVDLRASTCWTLLFAGPKTQSWGFWDRDTGRYTPWRQFIRAKGLELLEN